MYCHCSYNIKQKEKKTALQWRIDKEIKTQNYHQSTLVALDNVNLDQHDAVELHTTQQHIKKTCKGHDMRPAKS